MARNLTENQQKFLEVLFDEAGGDVVRAKQLAGYSDKTPTRLIVESLKDEIGAATRTHFARSAPKAVMALVDALSDPTELGIKDAYWMLLPCYLFILYYAHIGHRKRSW